MSEPYYGEIRMFAGNFAPQGWALCDGQLMQVSQNEALFSLLGTIYGGDGRTTFGLPDLRGRVPIHQGQGPGLTNRRIGQRGGVEKASVNANQTGAHSHTWYGSGDVAEDTDPTGHVTATEAGANIYGSNTSISLNANAIANSPGGGQTHNNLMPTLCIHFIISLFGTFPS